MRMPKASLRSRMSDGRARKGGRVTTSKARRSSRSARNSPLAAKSGRSTLVAATTRTSTFRVSSPPTRSNSPYSITRRICSWRRAEAVAISSRNRVPPSARSKRPRRLVRAPVKAPASWPNSSLSSRVSLSAAQFTLVKGPPHLGERKCRRSANSSLPVPRSPMTRAGRSSWASRETCSSASRKAGSEPSKAVGSFDWFVDMVSIVKKIDNNGDKG